jgi:urease accessory protein
MSQISRSEQGAIFAANRARGAVTVDVARADGASRRARVHEAGSLRVRFPTPEADELSAILINTAGGIAGGDRFDIAVAAERGAAVTVTTAAAEKLYRSQGDDAVLNVALRVEAGARLRWMPQETILFDGACARRRIDVDLAEDAEIVICEIVVFGRGAHGERMASGRFVDHWRVRRGGRLIFADSTRLDGDIGRLLVHPAGAGGGVAIGTILAAPAEEDFARRMRGDGDRYAGEFGVSSWNGMALARFCAGDAMTLRADMAAALSLAGIGAPRLWLN